MLITYTHGSSAFTTLFWFKLITLAVFFFFINSYKREEFYYYKNLGTSKLVLWSSALSFDLILFVFMLILTLKLR
jgi:hypothetical protein